ncbi:MAG: PspC domain-containing protein [Firmicutes bacterium]|nr:PspC domain-containing protein [Bacillota bacterium]
MKKLYRWRENKILGGVSGGIADYLGIDVVLVRIIWVILALSAGSGLMGYIICWVIIPEEPFGASVEQGDAIDSGAGERGRWVMGLFLIGLGVFYLLRRLNGVFLSLLNKLLPGIYWHKFWHLLPSLLWPMVFILAGTALIIGSLRGRKY